MDGIRFLNFKRKTSSGVPFCFTIEAGDGTAGCIAKEIFSFVSAAVPARFTPHGIHRRPSGRLKPYPAGRNDQRRTWRSRVLALRPNPVLLRLAPYPGFAVRPQGAPVATGALRHALRIALGMGSVSGCHSRRLVFREEPYACHPPEITPIPLWRIFQNGVTPIATITHGTLYIRKLNAIKKGMPHTEHPRPAPCRDYR